jgi:hypothetical protein
MREAAIPRARPKAVTKTSNSILPLMDDDAAAESITYFDATVEPTPRRAENTSNERSSKKDGINGLVSIIIHLDFLSF